MFFKLSRQFAKIIEIAVIVVILAGSLYAVAEAIGINRILGSNVVAGWGLPDPREGSLCGKM